MSSVRSSGTSDMTWYRLLEVLIPDEDERDLFVSTRKYKVLRKERLAKAIAPHAEDTMMGALYTTLMMSPKHPKATRDEIGGLFYRLLKIVFYRACVRQWKKLERERIAAEQQAFFLDASTTTLDYGKKTEEEERQILEDNQRLMEIMKKELSVMADEDRKVMGNFPSFSMFFLSLGPDRVLSMFRGEGSEFDQKRLVEAYMEHYDCSPSDRDDVANRIQRGLERLKRRLKKGAGATRKEVLG